MITWMQTHKKWLISTIWVSTIAFVGAGFVGWGSYDYGKSDGAIAKVGDKEVPLADLQTQYGALYSQYSSMFGGNFNQELAKQLKLEDAAFQKTIQQYLLLNYADELGLITTDEEVAKEILQIEAFHKDGKFDKNTYMSVLKQNRRTANEFEDQLKKELLVSKVQKLFLSDPSKQELNNIAKLLFIEDKVSINIIDSNNLKIDVKNDALEKFYGENKNNYMSPIGYKVAFTTIKKQKELDDKQMKKVALKEYLALKKGEKSFEKEDILYESSHFLNSEDFKTLTTSKSDEILKPILANDQYYVFKFIEKKDPTQLSFNEVKNQVTYDFKQKQKAILLDNKIANLKSNFKGKDLGFINRDSKISVDGLTDDQTKQLLNTILNSSEKISELKLEDKAVVFKIEQSRFTTIDQDKENMVKSIISNVKTNEASQSLLTKLQNKYEVKSYMGKE